MGGSEKSWLLCGGYVNCACVPQLFQQLINTMLCPAFSGNSSVNIFAVYLFKYKLLIKILSSSWIPCCNCRLLTNIAMTSAVTNFWCQYRTVRPEYYSERVFFCLVQRTMYNMYERACYWRQTWVKWSHHERCQASSILTRSIAAICWPGVTDVTDAVMTVPDVTFSVRHTTAR